MAKKIYALLVGINDYSKVPDTSNLYGCINDIETVEEYLRNRIATKNGKWKLVENSEVPWKLTDSLATRQAIIDGFEKHLCNAESEDVVLFYYAGHGSQEPAPDIFSSVEQDGKLETFVCYDSRTHHAENNKVRDLADKELNYLIEKIAKKDPHILVILDSCHSGTATRDPEVVERQANPDTQPRDLKDFIFPEEWINGRVRNDYQRPRHIAISACRDFQTAKEHTGTNGQPRGAFSYFLTGALQRTNGGLSYTNLVQDINALIIGKVKDQSPQIEGPAEDLRETFLGGAAGEPINYFTLTYDQQTHKNWVINGGILHGICPESEGKTSLAIFPQGTNLEDLQEIDKAICKAEVTQAMTEASKVVLFDNNNEEINLPREQAYWGVISDIPLPNLKVFFTGDEAGKNIIVKEFEKSENQFVATADSEENADYYLEADKGQYWITQPSDRKPLVAPVPELSDKQGYTQQRAKQIIKRLEHIARWKNILELKTPATSQIKADDVEMEVIVTSGGKEYSSQDGISPLPGDYTFEDNEFKEPEVNIKLTNKSEKELYFQVIELDGNYAINVAYFFEDRSSILLPSGRIREGEKLDLEIPREYLNNGITEYDTIYKLIVSTREFNADLLSQPGLDNPPPRNRSTDLSGTFNQLMDKVYTRGGKRKKDKYIDNWMTQEVKITLIKPPGGVEIKESESTNLLTGVNLQGHSSFKGKFSINPLPPISRDPNSNVIPPIFLQDKTPVLRDGKRLPEPYNFNMTRGGGNLSVLEIVDLENRESVTPDNPLKLLVDKQLSGEHILPVAYDGEFFLPLGQAKTVNRKTEISIERLPEPITDSRSLQGSIKILFQKIIYESAGKGLGAKFPYPLLRIANISDTGRVTYDVNSKEIREKVASANKILLYIHGIIGDTESLLPSVQLTAEFTGESLKDKGKYNLILAFEYESIKTKIQQSAKDLKQRLEEVGLTANHGKQLHIVAHSMGGLVSRAFIEQEGGNEFVQHLVMLGTPNAGSPWSQVQDWGFTALGIGLNQLSSVAWPINIISGLLAFLEANDDALDQMKYQSDFMQSIAQNNDPNVQYTIIAGDRSIRPEALQVESGKNFSKVQRLMQKLFGSAVDNAVNMAFFNQPNDIAVSLESMTSISTQRNPQPRIISPIACDHLTYFTSEAGLRALAEALYEDL